MQNQPDAGYAKSSRAEAPWVLAYVAVSIMLALGWSNFNRPSASVMQSRPITPAAIALPAEVRADDHKK